ncbi:hypothetical protein GGI23_007593 [Coemansia sp. RSA 2559]|nr:hypothetical protein GGI23_007593 [Coemansia sp. RSA 2559]
MEEARRQMEALEELLEQEEEDLLERELNKLVLDSSEMRKPERASNRLDVGIPMGLMGKSSTPQRASTTNLSALRETNSDSYSRYESRGSGDESESENEVTDSDDYNAIRFSLLTGKRQKPVVRDVDIPLESQIAKNLRQQEEVAMREKAHLKRFVLSYQRREAEEEQHRYERELELRRASRIAAVNAPKASVVPGATFVGRAAQLPPPHSRRKR